MQIALAIKVVFLASRLKLVYVFCRNFKLMAAFQTRIIDYPFGLAFALAL